MFHTFRLGCLCLGLFQLENMSTRKHDSLKTCQLVPFYSCTDLKQVVTTEEVLLVEPRLIAELEGYQFPIEWILALLKERNLVV